MNIIKTIKSIFFQKNDKIINTYINNENQITQNQKKSLLNFSIDYYKYIFKSNYKNKKSKKNSVTVQNFYFFYILKGAIYVIEDWWKKILIIKENRKKILQRNFNNKNYQIFRHKNKNNNKNKLSESRLIKSMNIQNIKKFEIKERKNDNNNINLNSEENTTLINSESCFFDFNSNNNVFKKENKVGVKKDNNETKRDYNIIYPIKEIDIIIKKDLLIDKKKQNKKENLNIDKNNNIFCNNKIKSKKDFDRDKITIPLEEQNSDITYRNNAQQNYELFNEIKSKIKQNLKNSNKDSEIISLIQNKYLLKENPFDESSIYIRNSDLKKDELLRNVNIHLIPSVARKISLNKNMDNSYSSNIILNDDDYDYEMPSLLNSFFLNEEVNDKNKNIIRINKEKSNFYKKMKENIRIHKKPSKTEFENIYKN